MELTITIKDGRTDLWQWDTGRKLQITGDIRETDWVHFRLHSSTALASVHPYQSGGVMLADIPDELLQTGKRLVAYVYVADDDGNKTTIRKEIMVQPRTKPEDYAYTPTEIMHWTDLEARIKKLEEGGATPEQIAAAVEAYLLEHPVDVSVTSVNGKTGAVELRAEDVGALGQDKLQTGVNTALAQAKASGEFDGSQGPQGPQGTTGKSAYQYAQDGGYAGTEAEFAAKLAEEMPDALPNPNALTFTGAVTGSYDGTDPLEVAIPSGGGASYRSWSKVWALSVAEDIAGFAASSIDLDGKSEIMIVFISDSTSSRTMLNGRFIINGVDAGKVLFNSLALKKDSHSFIIIGRADDGIEYTTMAAAAEYQTYPWQGEVKIVHRMVAGIDSTIQWTSDSTIEITQASATLGKGVTIEIYVR